MPGNRSEQAIGLQIKQRGNRSQ